VNSEAAACGPLSSQPLGYFRGSRISLFVHSWTTLSARVFGVFSKLAHDAAIDFTPNAAEAIVD
jgi:hypothetical protein